MTRHKKAPQKEKTAATSVAKRPVQPTSVHPVLQMQQLLGNQAVTRMLSDRHVARQPNGMTVMPPHQLSDAPAVQRALPEKVVSSKAMGRLDKATAAIKHTKEVFHLGAGNQQEALEAHNFNTMFKLMVMRNKDEDWNDVPESTYWNVTDEAKKLADANPEAHTAAKADFVAGGNCGEHAEVAIDYLRTNAIGEELALGSVEKLDHAFVFIGTVYADDDNELVIADPWPTRPTATTWFDHFAYRSDPSKIEISSVMFGDGKNPKAAIAAGLSLTDEAKALSQKKLSEEETQTRMEEEKDWIWNHEDTAREDHKFDYVEEDKEDEGGLKSSRFKGDPRLESAHANSPVMRRGEKGEAVRKIQQALVDLGYKMPESTNEDGTLDGIYGWETHRIIYRFQQDKTLEYKDGSVGNETLSKLDELLQ